MSVSRKRRQIKRLWDFKDLVRDQEVEGSNPFAPTTFFLPSHIDIVISSGAVLRIIAGTQGVDH